METVAKVVISPKDNSKTASVYEMPTQEVITVAQNDEASIQSSSIATTAPVVNVKGMADQTIAINQNIKEAKQISKQEIKAMKIESEEFDEKQFLSTELASIGKKEFGVDIQVFGATDEDIYDPKGKARHARPFKPAILIE